MTSQPTLFDAPTSEAAKTAGIDQAASNHGSLLAYARTVAREIALRRADHTCTADDVALALEERGISCRALGNAAGALFRDGWQWTGRFEKSARVHAHANLLRVWRLTN